MFHKRARRALQKYAGIFLLPSRRRGRRRRQIYKSLGEDAIPQKIVIPVTLIPNKKWYFKKTSRSPLTIKEFGYASKNVE
jgi:hypothetical protein